MATSWWWRAIALLLLGFVAPWAIGMAAAGQGDAKPEPSSAAPPSENDSDNLGATKGPSAETDPAVERFDQLLREVETIWSQAARQGRGDADNTIPAEAAKLRERLTGAFHAAKISPYAVHVVYLGEGGAPPPGFLKGPDRFATRFAEVRISDVSQRTVLVLSSPQKTHWRVSVADGVKLMAVLLDGAKGAECSGLPDSTLMLTVGGRDEEEQSWYDDEADDDNRYGGYRSRWGAWAGAKVSTVLGSERYLGKPIVVGPENAGFRAQLLAREARALQRRAVTLAEPSIPAELTKLVFPAVHYFSYDNGQWVSAGTADFTARGPIAASMRHRSGKLTNFVFDKRENLEFALSGGELVLVDKGREKWETVARDAEEPALGALTSLTLDTTRRRIVAAAGEKTLFAYDLEQAAWSKLEPVEHSLAVVTYVPARDCFYALTGAGRAGEGAGRRGARAGRPSRGLPEPATGIKLLKLAPSGKLSAIVNDSIGPDIWPGGSLHRTQLVFVESRLALVGGSHQQRDGRAPGSIAIFDTDTGKTLYHGRTTAWREQEKSASRRDVVAELPPPDNRIGRMLRHLHRVASAIDELRAAGKPERASRIEQRLAAVRGTIRGAGADPPARAPAVHLVGCYEQKNLEVRVTDKSRPTTLVLCAYDPATWKLSVREGVRLAKVIVAGYHRQQVTGVPAGVPLESYVYEDRAPRYFYTYRVSADGHSQAMAAIRELTGSEPATMHLRYRFANETVVVGPEGQDWRLQQAAPDLAALAGPFAAADLARRQSALADLRFRALFRISPTSDDERRRPFAGRPGEIAAESEYRWPELTVPGPELRLAGERACAIQFA